MTIANIPHRTCHRTTGSEGPLKTHPLMKIHEWDEAFQPATEEVPPPHALLNKHTLEQTHSNNPLSLSHSLTTSPSLGIYFKKSSSPLTFSPAAHSKQTHSNFIASYRSPPPPRPPPRPPSPLQTLRLPTSFLIPPSPRMISRSPKTITFSLRIELVVIPYHTCSVR